ncbi:hypothetical protein K474DRAFT_1665292 [Panus rudis PR-1116 ss-1]|nr:hypothetical protein K474DRAFT_1665292 [Panus rudis PR-1116 ss-1]
MPPPVPAPAIANLPLPAQAAPPQGTNRNGRRPAFVVTLGPIAWTQNVRQEVFAVVSTHPRQPLADLDDATSRQIDRHNSQSVRLGFTNAINATRFVQEWSAAPHPTYPQVRATFLQR